MSGGFGQYGPRFPKPHKAMHELGGEGELDLSGLAGTSELIFRGSFSPPDFTITELSVVAAWTDLDCSSIVPANSVAILFQSKIRGSSVGQKIQLRYPGAPTQYPCFICTTFCGGYDLYFQGLTICGANRHVEYHVGSSTITTRNFSVAGWII